MVEDHTIDEIHRTLLGKWSKGEINVWIFPFGKGSIYKAQIYAEIDLGVVIYGGSYVFVDLPTGLILCSATYCRGFDSAVYDFITTFIVYKDNLKVLASRREDLIELHNYYSATRDYADSLVSDSACFYTPRFKSVFTKEFAENDYIVIPEMVEPFG